MYLVMQVKRSKKKNSIRMFEKKKHMYSANKAKALDKRYEDLLNKICIKHELPPELNLEILSYIKGMVHSGWLNRQDENIF